MPGSLMLGLLTLLTVSATGPTTSDEATLEAARRLLIATHFVERNLPPPDVAAIVQSAAVDCMARQADQDTPKSDCRSDGRRVEQLARAMAATYPVRKARLFAQAAEIYARHFSRDDMERAALFYESDTGQRLFAATDALAREFRVAQSEDMAKLGAGLTPESKPAGGKPN